MIFEERNSGFKLADISFKLSGKKAMISEEIINGKKVKLILTYYNKKSYNKDFADWKSVQERKNLHENTQMVEGFKKYGFSIKKIDYSKFTDISNRFIARIVFQVFSDNSDLLAKQDEILVQIKIIRKERWIKDEEKNIYEHNDAFPQTVVNDPNNDTLKYGIVDPRHVYMTFTGIYVLQSIVAPFVYNNRIDYNFMYKYLAHEMDHYIKFARQACIQDVFSTKLTPYLSKKGNDLLDYLYLTLFWLIAEGSAEFRKTRNSPSTLIVPEAIKGFRILLENMMSIKDKKTLEDYFQKNIYAGSNSGVYACGMYMCYFIAYSLDKQSLIMDYDLHNNKNFALAISSNKQFKVSNISKEAFDATMELIGRSDDPFYFVKVYDAACKKLKIPEESMIISIKMFRRYWKNAESEFTEKIIKKLRALEYYPEI